MSGLFNYPTLIILSLILGLAPFFPEPHIVEKLRMLFSGTLKKPVDIFDLLMHAAPILALLTKAGMDLFAMMTDKS